jgi:hypothetical protein
MHKFSTDAWRAVARKKRAGRPAVNAHDAANGRSAPWPPMATPGIAQVLAAKGALEKEASS